MAPAMVWLSDAPIPTAVAIAPSVRLNRPRATSQIGDHQDGKYTKNASTDTVEHLDADQQSEILLVRV